MKRKAIIVSIKGKYLTNQEKTLLSKEKPWGIILFGSESQGVSEHLKKYVDKWISIKKNGAAESLNVSVSVGIILHKLS